MELFNTMVIAGALLAVPISTAAAGPCTAEIENVAKLMAAQDAGAGPTTGAGGAAGAQPADPRAQHPPTAIIGQQTQGEATSPQDVQSQSRGGPTAAKQAQGARRPAAEALASAQAALEEARGLDRAGKGGRVHGCYRACKEVPWIAALLRRALVAHCPAPNVRVERSVTQPAPSHARRAAWQSSSLLSRDESGSSN